MQPRIHVVTLAVESLERSLAFYRSLGLESPGIIGTEFSSGDDGPAGAIVNFQLEAVSSWPCIRAGNWHEMRRCLCSRPARGPSVSAMPLPRGRKWTSCSMRLKRQEQS